MSNNELSWLDRTRAIPYSISTLIPARQRLPLWAGLLIAILGFSLLGGLVALTVIAFTQRSPGPLPVAAAVVAPVDPPAPAMAPVAAASDSVQAAAAPAASERAAAPVRAKKHRVAKRHVAAKRTTALAKSSARKRGGDDEISKLLRGL